jgi:hypothetical protein
VRSSSKILIPELRWKGHQQAPEKPPTQVDRLIVSAPLLGGFGSGHKWWGRVHAAGAFSTKQFALLGAYLHTSITTFSH